MIRVIFLAYWFWHATWVYRFYYSVMDFKMFTLEGLNQFGFIAIAPIVWHKYFGNNKDDHKWLGLCIATAICRLITINLAYFGVKSYGIFYLLSAIIVAVYCYIDIAFAKNTDSVRYP